MPIIVPVENDVDISGLTDKKFKAADYSGSGLEALGAGLSTLGSGGQELADALDEKRRNDLAAAALAEKQRQDQALATALAKAKLGPEHQSNIDDALAKKAYGGYADQSADLLYGPDGLFNQRGTDAHAAFPGTVSGLADSYDKALALLDPVQRNFIAPILTDRMNSDVDRATRHVQQEGVAAQRGAAANLVDTATRDAVLHADAPDLHDHHLQTGVNAIRQQGRLENVPDAVLGKQIDDYTSGVHAGMIGDLIPHDPVQAAGQYAQFGNQLNPSDKLLVEAKLGPALAKTQAIADADAASNPDPTVAPVNPHAGDDATTLLKMQGITPMMDQTELPALMQRYGNDPAKAWAAFEAGPETIDRLIAARGDDWYAGLDNDTRRFVDGNMRMLGAARSPRGTSTVATPLDVFQGLGPWQYPDATGAGEYGAFHHLQAGEAAIGRISPNAPAYPVGLMPASFDMRLPIVADETEDAPSTDEPAGRQEQSLPLGSEVDHHPTTAQLNDWLTSLSDDVGALARKTESQDNSAEISSGKGDAGGPSYGSYQLAQNRGQVPEFLAREGAPWAKELSAAPIYSEAFKSIWKKIALRDGQKFKDAENAFAQRTKYEPVMRAISKNLHLNLNTRSVAVRGAVTATANHMGPGGSTHDNGGYGVVRRAVVQTDRSLSRDDPDYDRQLVDNIYEQRKIILLKQADHLATQSEDPRLSPADRAEMKRRAVNLRSSAQNVFTNEHNRALAIIAKEKKIYPAGF